MYTKVMELNYWTLERVHSAPATTRRRREWTVTRRPRRRDGGAAAEAVGRWPPACRACPTCRRSPAPKASRATSTIPASIPAARSSAARSAWCIGSNNSAHDICADLWEHGADVTMIQRSSTHIARSDTLMELALGGLYSEAGRAVRRDAPTTADLIFASIPYKIMHTFQIPVYQEMARRDAEFYARLDEGRLHARLRRRRLGAVHEVPAPRLGLLHRCRRHSNWSPTAHQAQERRRRRAFHRALGGLAATAPSCRPT